MSVSESLGFFGESSSKIINTTVIVEIKLKIIFTSSQKLGFPQAEQTPIYEDNFMCIKWAGVTLGGSLSDCAKHIDLRLLSEHFVHEAQNSKVLQLVPIHSTDDGADLLTKR